MSKQDTLSSLKKQLLVNCLKQTRHFKMNKRYRKTAKKETAKSINVV